VSSARQVRLLLATDSLPLGKCPKFLAALRKGVGGIRILVVGGLPDSIRDDASGPGALALTPRQVEVLRGIAMGFSMKEIAHRLKISPKTAETHRSNILERLGIRGIPGLVRYALRRGVVPISWLTEED